MTNFTLSTPAQLTATESVALGTVATIANFTSTIATAARTFHQNEIASGLLQADIKRSAYTLLTLVEVVHMVDRELSDRAIAFFGPKVRQLAKSALYWAIFACIYTWTMWLSDTSEQVTAQARIAVYEIEQAVKQEPLAGAQTGDKTLRYYLQRLATIARLRAAQMAQNTIARWAVLLQYHGG